MGCTRELLKLFVAGLGGGGGVGAAFADEIGGSLFFTFGAVAGGSQF